VLERQRAFAAAGGKVVFVTFATLEPTPDLTAKVVAALPKPDVKLDSACAPIKYMHCSLKDGDAYFFFNESKESESRTATVASRSQVQVWDANSGTIAPLMDAIAEEDTARFSLSLAPYESKSIVSGPASRGRDPAMYCHCLTASATGPISPDGTNGKSFVK
jgi:hypothetical protein